MRLWAVTWRGETRSSPLLPHRGAAAAWLCGIIPDAVWDIGTPALRIEPWRRMDHGDGKPD
ncbi:MAG: hypothetical protein E6R03_07215 [Hyphomicrobiaceae bacterium]|nr:MAG: hypothetical protein E6R03_07215 [Hyphomicrobiaceae bacterium]